MLFNFNINTEKEEATLFSTQSSPELDYFVQKLNDCYKKDWFEQRIYYFPGGCSLEEARKQWKHRLLGRIEKIYKTYLNCITKGDSGYILASYTGSVEFDLRKFTNRT